MRKNIILSVFLLLILASCSDFLDQKPSDNITTSEAITELSDVKTSVNGLYSLMASTYYYNASMFLYGDVKGDDMQPTYWSSGRTAYPYYMFEHSADVPNSGGLWGRPYYIIRNAYNILSRIDSKEIKASDDELSEYKGECLAAIALCYFDLTRVYGYPYDKDKGQSPGVPILTEAIQDHHEPLTRNTVAECYDFVIKTLKEAIPLLTTSRHDGYINSWAARALLARTYLYYSKNEEAYDTADQLIKDINASGLYWLASNEDYVAQFALDNKFGSEALFQISNTTNDNPGRDGLSYLLHWWGYAAVVCTDSFAKFMNQDLNDVRSKLVASYPNGDGTYYSCLLKYPGTDEESPSFENNYTVIRLSEVYLIAAEAGVKAGGERRAGGLDYLNTIVKRGDPANSVTNVDYTLDRVLDERRKELVGEGHRYFDLLRNGKDIVRKGGKHLDGAPELINWNYTKCVLPISRDEFTFNPDMQQNEGYHKD